MYHYLQLQLDLRNGTDIYMFEDKDSKNKNTLQLIVMP